MTVFRILFVVFLALPVGACMVYFVSNMLVDFKSVKNVKYEQAREQNNIKKQKKKKKKRPEEGYLDGPGEERMQRQVVRQPYYRSPEIKQQAYPMDPYADYRRPDLDSYIRNANARDRAAKESLDQDPGARRRKRTSAKPKTKPKAKTKDKPKRRKQKRTTRKDR